MSRPNLDPFDHRMDNGYPTHRDNGKETLSKAARRSFLYCAALTMLIILISSTFSPSLAITFYALALVGLGISLWRLTTSRRSVQS